MLRRLPEGSLAMDEVPYVSRACLLTPRIAQNRSVCWCSLATMMSPVGVTSCISSTLSAARPYLALIGLWPPPVTNPPIPTSGSPPPAILRFAAATTVYMSRHCSPAPIVTAGIPLHVEQDWGLKAGFKSIPWRLWVQIDRPGEVDLCMSQVNGTVSIGRKVDECSPSKKVVPGTFDAQSYLMCGCKLHGSGNIPGTGRIDNIAWKWS